MKTHQTKIQKEFASSTINGTKPFEIRFNDRNYQCGDKVEMEVYDGEILAIPHTVIYADVGDVLSFNQKKGWVVFGLLNIDPEVANKENNK